MEREYPLLLLPKIFSLFFCVCLFKTFFSRAVSMNMLVVKR